MGTVVAPQPGDFAAWPVGWPGPEIDYALCIQRDGEMALLRHQAWQLPGPWHETWVTVTGAAPHGCWKTERLHEIGPALRAERASLFPDADTLD